MSRSIHTFRPARTNEIISLFRAPAVALFDFYPDLVQTLRPPSELSAIVPAALILASRPLLFQHVEIVFPG